MPQDVVTLEHVEVGERDGTAHRVAREGESVHEAVVGVQEGLDEPVAGNHGSERGVAARDALGHGDDVGLVPVADRAEVLAEPAEGADHLVRHEEHAVPVADLADALEVARGWREAAPGVLHRLEEDGRHRLGPLHQDRPLDLVRRVAPEGLDVVVEVGRPVEVGVGDLP